MVFPATGAAWRLAEVQHCVVKYDCDIIAMHMSSHVHAYFSGNGSANHGLAKRHEMFEPGWRELNESHQLWRYDILIFRREWNWLQRFNEQSFDGCAFNGLAQVADSALSGDYMLRLRSKRGAPLDLLSYDGYYSIFCWVFTSLATLVERAHIRSHRHVRYADWGRHVVKAYPGAGALGCSAHSQRSDCLCRREDDPIGCISSLSRTGRSAVRVITTQGHVHDCLRRGLPGHAHLTLIMPIIINAPPPVPRAPLLRAPLSVCLTVAAATRAHQRSAHWHMCHHP